MRHVGFQPAIPVVNTNNFLFITATTQQQPYIIYTQAPYNPQQVTSQQFPQPQYNGIVYPPGKY
jgi:hypothetical protein